MKDRIKFSDEMLAAVIDGRKTQTRRPADFKVREEGYNLNFSGLKSGFYCNDAPSSGFVLRSMGAGCWNDRTYPLHCPYGQVGDVIPFADKDGNIKGEIEIVDVWLQQAQDISRADAIAEGAPPSHPTIDAVSREYGFPDFSRSWFWQTWWHIYGKENWQANPWVWVVEFKQIQG
ncbi:PmgT domain-containing protein [Morganella morganii]|uniref:PmgT domain-containing protein n=1 Tax=Morganella morganii TaxID=582 RepID=UPI000538470D|nr:PmgT domain-containing protein [Morganella morganii]